MASSSTPLGLVLLVGVVGGVVGGAGGYLALRDPPAPVRYDRFPPPPGAVLLQEVQEMRAELAEMRARQAERVVPSRERVEPDTAIEVEEPPVTEADKPQQEPSNSRFDATKFAVSLRTEPFGIELSDKIIEVLSINKDQIEPTIAALKKELKNDPENPELWSALGAAYFAKLASGEAEGPAAARVYRDVMQAYDKAIQYDEHHWTARYSKAFTTSMAPEFVGLRPASIRMFEDVVQRQEARPNAREYARCYMRLGTLYKDAGNMEKAKQIWKKGLRLYADDRQLTEALEVAEKK